MADINLNIALQIQEATASIKKFSDVAVNSLAGIDKQSKKTNESLSSIANSASITGQAISTALGNLASGAITLAADSAKKLFNSLKKGKDLHDPEKKEEIINKIMGDNKRRCSMVNSCKTELNIGSSKKCQNCSYCKIKEEEKLFLFNKINKFIFFLDQNHIQMRR